MLFPQEGARVCDADDDAAEIEKFLYSAGAAAL
jgi:hypothetical protein